MKTALVLPSRESEKAISGYSVNLLNALKKNKVDVTAETYTAGAPFSFFKIMSRLKNYDIIHIQHEYSLLGWYGIPFFFIFLFLGLLKKGKLVITMHTVPSQKQKFRGNFIKNFFRKLLYFFQNWLINRVSDHIIVHANFFVPILVNEYNFPREKITVLPQGIIEGIKIIPKDKAKKNLGISGKVYLIIGNLVPDHGADIIIEHAKKIGKTTLVVTSPKPINDRKQKRLTNYINYCINYVKDNKLSSYVRFDIRNVNDKMPLWWEYFSAADFVMQAYRGGIGSGILTHAIATKTPVIASDILFFREIAKKYGCIKIAKKEGDYPAIMKKWLKPKNYSKMVKECGRYLKENSWVAVAEKYKKLYGSLK